MVVIKKKKLPKSGASSSSTHPLGGNYEGGDKQQKGNDYQVFLSFRWKDTGKGFTDYLYTSLSDAGIRVSKDDNELCDGSELRDRIMQSQILIPIISENYVFSNRCICELALMLECKRKNGQIVWPIFYKVAPEKLGDGADAQEENLDEKVVEEWKEALQKVSTFKKWESEKTYDGCEGKLVKDVVNRVKSALEKTVQSNIPIELVGINDHLEKIMSLIGAEYNGTRIIGIYGMSGIGKTTLARALYDNLYSRFKHLSFVANIRETSLHKGIECVQNQLINDILRSAKDVSTVKEGICVIKSRFTDKKVLIILDDMDDHAHLNALIGDGSWFKAGSVVIITTRDKSILDEPWVKLYSLEELPLSESLILFKRHAFRENSFLFMMWHARVIKAYIGGLPLTLEVIGSFLRGKKKGAWARLRRKLKRVSCKTVQEKLRIVFEELKDVEKHIFLDIACFFSGSSKQSPTYMWGACDYDPKRVIAKLNRMSLIKIDEDGKLMMHDQLRDLGREIVHLENQKEPQKHSRLWIYKEAVDVLDNNKGTSKIEALCLDKCEYTKSYTGDQFKELANLRFLKVCGANFTGDFQNLLPNLRWLQWECCPSDFAATNFHPKKLVVLNLSRSGISEDWGGWGPLKMATKLKVLDLTGCLSLRRTPDLSAFISLEILILEECENLETIHPSIEDIKTLVSLNVRRCGKLAHLPESMSSFESLAQLDVSHSGIEGLPESMGSLTSLIQLDLSYSWIEELPEFMGALQSLTQLDISHSGIREFPKSISSLESLTQLDVSQTGIEELPRDIYCLKKLQTLNASWCGLASIPRSIRYLTSLSLLDLRRCTKLKEIPDTIGSLGSLKRLLLRGCCLLSQIPSSIANLTSLTELDLKYVAIEKLPYHIRNLKSLRILDIRGTQIRQLPHQFHGIARVDRKIKWD